jgi:hypothetical protein
MDKKRVFVQTWRWEKVPKTSRAPEKQSRRASQWWLATDLFNPNLLIDGSMIQYKR